MREPASVLPVRPAGAVVVVVERCVVVRPQYRTPRMGHTLIVFRGCLLTTAVQTATATEVLRRDRALLAWVHAWVCVSACLRTCICLPPCLPARAKAG